MKEKIQMVCIMMAFLKKSGLEEITLSSTLENMGRNIFRYCYNLRVVWVTWGCRFSIKNYVKDSVAVLSTKTKLGGRLLREIREQKRIVIPNGVQKIKERWFMNSEAESVKIPASVTELWKEAFRGCKKLKRVTFAKNSGLKKIGYRCFHGSGIEDITLPRTLKEIGEATF